MGSSALAVSQPGSLLPADNEFDKMLRMAGEFAQSGILPKGIPPKPAAVLYIVQTGYELGIPPGAGLRMISLVEGKPTLDAQMQRALIYRDHGDDAFRFVETDAKRCTVEYKRRGWQASVRFTLTIDEIAPEPRKKFNWQNYPANMLRARTTTFVANMAFSDSTLGLYAADELIEATGGEVGVGADGEPIVIAARLVDDDGVIHEQTSMTLPLDLDAAQWAKLHAKATERGVDFDPRMSPDQLAGAIKKAGGPRITGKINAGVLWSALDHVTTSYDEIEDDEAATGAEAARQWAKVNPAPVPVSAEAPIRDDEIVVEQAALVDGGR